jgi:hypothetical protein
MIIVVFVFVVVCCSCVVCCLLLDDGVKGSMADEAAKMIEGVLLLSTPDCRLAAS